MRTLPEFIRGYDSMKDDAPSIEGMASIAEAGSAWLPTAERLLEWTGVDIHTLGDVARARALNATAALSALVMQGTDVDEAAQAIISGAWADGYIAGVLWEQERGLEEAIG